MRMFSVSDVASSLWYIFLVCDKYVIDKVLLFSGELPCTERYDCNGKGDSRETWLPAEIQGHIDYRHFLQLSSAFHIVCT